MTAVPVPQSALTAEVIEAVEQSLRVNPNWSAAADYAGITDRTLRTYRERANTHQSRIDAAKTPSEVSAIQAHPDWPYWEAHQRWQKARSRGEIELVATIRKVATEGDWRAAQALAKMGWPDRYSDRVELTGAGGGPIQVSAAELDARAEEAFARAQAKLEAATGSGESAEPAPTGNQE